MIQKYKKCPICKCEKSKLLFNDGHDYFIANGKSDDFSVYFCKECHMGYSTPFLTEKELSKYYPDDFEAYVPKKSLMGYLQKIKYRQDLKLIKKSLNIKNLNDITFFEIGAGRGEFLHETQIQGCHIEGIEPGEKGVKFAKENYNINLQLGFASELKFKKKYDVIVMRHVLEHLNNFKGCLENIKKYGLNKNGILFIKVPNIAGWESKLFGKYYHGFDLPRHRFHFTSTGIIKLLQQIDFDNTIVFDEYISNDCIRSLFNYIKYSKSSSRKLLYIFIIMPKMLLYFLITPIFLIISFLFGPGRMIAITHNNQK